MIESMSIVVADKLISPEIEISNVGAEFGTSVATVSVRFDAVSK